MKNRIAVILLTSFLMMGCSKFVIIQKSENISLKYKAALQYYEKKKYYKAGVLFEELVPLLKGQAEAEKANFYFAYCQYYQGNLVLSAYYFKKFNETFPRSDFGEEALYMYCISLYDDSPDFELDQSNTITAIESFQQYLERYPKSRHLEDCNRLIDELTFKLETKAFAHAKQFFRMREYKAAVTSFDNVAKDFPSSKYVEECLFYKFQSQFYYGNISIESKRKERYELANEYYYSFIDKYPNSKFIKEAEKDFEELQLKIQELETGVKRKTFWDKIGMS